MPESRPIAPRFKLRRFTIGSLILLAAWPVWRLVSGFSIQSGKCRDNFTHADMISIQNALDFYQLKTGSFPTTEQGLKALIKKPTRAPVPSHWVQIVTRDYIDAWKRPYAYRFPGRKDRSKPEIYSMGVEGIQETDDDIHRDDE